MCRIQGLKYRKCTEYRAPNIKQKTQNTEYIIHDIEYRRINKERRIQKKLNLEYRIHNTTKIRIKNKKYRI